MSAIQFKHLKPKTIQQPKPEPKKTIWQLFKSQMGLFGGTETARVSKLGHGIPFAMNKEKESHNVGEVKSEGGKQYIFLETTIGKPRWHSHEELTQMAKEGKKIPEIAKKKMPGLEKPIPKEEKKAEAQNESHLSKDKEEIKVGDYIYYGGDPRRQGFSEKLIHSHELKQVTGFKDLAGVTYPTWKPDKKISKYDKGYGYPSKEYSIIKDADTFLNPKESKKEEESKQSEIPSEQLSKPKATAEEQYVQDKIKQGNLEPAIKRQQGMKKTEATEEQKAQQVELSKLIQRKAQLQREIDSPLEANRSVEKGGQKFDVNTKEYAKREMKQIDKKIGNLKQALGKLGEGLFEQHEDMFSQSPAKPKDALSENINKKVIEQGEKEKPTLKQLMTTQAEVLKLAEIPEEDIAMYALNSMADGAKLRSYSTEVMKGEMTAEQAADKVKGDYTKMKEGEKPTNAGELPSEEKEERTADEILKGFKTEKEAREYLAQKKEGHEGVEEDGKPVDIMYDKAGRGVNLKTLENAINEKYGVEPEASTEQKKPWEIAKENIKPYEESLRKLTEKELRTEDKNISNAINKWANDTPTIIDGKLNPKIGNDPAYFELSEKLAAIGREQEARKDTLPLLPSEKDSKEGDTKSINGITYELKRGESGELRWHRVTEEEKKEKSIPTKDEFRKLTGQVALNINEDNPGFVMIDVLPNVKATIVKKLIEAGYDASAVKDKNVVKINKAKSENQSDSITMPKQEAIDEHKNLVKVLESGTEEERKAEAKKQAEELEGYQEGMDEGTPEDAPERTLKELVEERLNEKQENKKFKDVGNRVGGSKKEIAAIKVLTMDDLSKMDNATAYKVVTKDRILADIDPTAEKAAGVESGAAYLKKKLREALMARPLNSQEARKKYLELIPKIFDKIDSCKTVEELSNLGRDYFDIWRSFRGKGVKIHFKGDENNDLIDVLGKEFANLIGRNSDSAKEHWNNAKLMSPVSQETSDKHYKQFEEAKKNAYKINKDRMDAYTPEQWENYFKNDPMVTYSFTRRQLADQKKNEPEKYREAIEKYKAQNYKNNEIRNEVPPYLKWTAQSPSYAVREESWKWAEPKTEEKKVIQKAKDELKIHDNPPLAFIKRTNGREVKNSDVSAEALTKKYGFKSVQLGNYVKDAEAKEHIRHFVESMNDLEDVLGVDIKKMNELSGLSIAFGARGGGRSSAHYEPMSKIINLTKSMADGAVAHEFFHCIDHLLGGMREGTRTENIFLSQTPEANKGKLGEAMKGVMDAIKKGNNIITKPFQPNEQKYTYASIRRTFEQKGFEFTKNDIMKYVKDGRDLGQAEDYFKYLATLSGKPIEVDFETRRSKFYDGALSFKSDYWKRPLEMFARAAESYIQDKIMSKDMYNNYLVGGNNIQQPDRKWENTEYLTMAYPQGEERVRINEAFDKLIEAAKEELNIGVDKPKEGKRISSEVQMQKSLYNPNIFQSIFRAI